MLRGLCGPKCIPPGISGVMPDICSLTSGSRLNESLILSAAASRCSSSILRLSASAAAATAAGDGVGGGGWATGGAGAECGGWLDLAAAELLGGGSAGAKPGGRCGLCDGGGGGAGDDASGGNRTADPGPAPLKSGSAGEAENNG